MRSTRRILVVALLVVGSIGLARAGEVYGKITQQGAPVAAASVSAKCGGTDYPAVSTDAGGSYHLNLKETGKCTLSVGFKGQTAEIGVASYAEGVQVDLVLESKDGKLSARRK